MRLALSVKRCVSNYLNFCSSQLRLLPRWRGRSRVILRGFQVCRDLLGDGQQETPYYFTSILSDNSFGSAYPHLR